MAFVDMEELVEAVVKQVLQKLSLQGAGALVDAEKKGSMPLVAANWKMNFPAHFQSEKGDLSKALDDFSTCLSLAPLEKAQTVVMPPSSLLYPLNEVFKKHGLDVQLGAQDMHPAASGPHTGELSGLLLRAAGAEWVIVGHSERRAAGESDEVVAEKLDSVLEQGFGAILCVGETLKQRRDGSTFRILRLQLSAALSRVVSWRLDPGCFAVAYEPVWAIGTGENATTDQISEAAAFCRQMVAEAFDYNVAKRVRILYGGSVKPGNTAGIMRLADVDGVLVGGASLDGESFGEITSEVVRESVRKAEVARRG